MIMKPIVKTIIFASFAALATSCTDLDVPVKSQYTQYPSSEVAVEAQMADVYYHLRGTYGRRYNEAQELSSDEWIGVSFDGDYYDDGTYANTSLHDFKATDQSIGWYDDVAAGISKANRVIVNMGGDDADPSAIAPARAMRAYFHWLLMDSYGDIPILNGIPADGEAVERQPRADVARYIESELKDVIPYLTTEVSDDTYGKPTRWMAEALLAKLYINWAVYTASDVTAYDAATATNEKLDDCVALCDDIIQSGQFSISEGATTYREKFYPNNGSQIKDFIYALPYHTTEAKGLTYARFRTFRKSNGSFNSYYGMQLSQSCAGNFSMTPEAADLFTLEGDERNDHILGGTVYMYDGTTYAKTTTPFEYKGAVLTFSKDFEFKDKTTLNVGANVKGWSTGYKSVKWYLIDDDYKNGRNQSNDVPIFRLADIILLKAEAITRGAAATNGATAQSLFNEIRTYAHAPLIDHNPSLQEILDERGRELFDENWRRNDMIRFGTFENEYGAHKSDFPNARFEKTRRVFPIPQTVLNENTNWQQNAGY